MRVALGGPTISDGVWAENAAAVSAFIAASSQWRVASIGGGFVPAALIYIGLDYAGVRIGIEAAGITITPDMWSRVRIMEAAACAALNENRK